MQRPVGGHWEVEPGLKARRTRAPGPPPHVHQTSSKTPLISAAVYFAPTAKQVYAERCECFPLDPPDDPKRQASAEPLGGGPDIRMCSEALSSLCHLFSRGFPSTGQ